MKNPPYCQWYPGDWIRDTRTLTLEERGAYKDLLALILIKGELGQLQISVEELGLVWNVSIERVIAICESFRRKDIVTLDVTNLTAPNGNLTVLSRRIERDQKTYQSNISRQKRFYDRHKKRKPNANLTDKKSEVRSHKQIKDSSEPPFGAAEPPAATEPIVMVFPTVGKGQRFDLVQSQFESLKKGFPSVDILAECAKALAWCDMNPARRKTAKGMPKFLYSWMERSQNKGGAAPAAQGADDWRIAKPTAKH